MNGMILHPPIVYVIRDGVKVFANPNLKFDSDILLRFFRWASMSPDKASRAYRAPCKAFESYEDAAGEFLFVWHHEPETTVA